ncbi:hypothetical protein SANTM175S_05439 [Streptomyces antimycoticus]
MGTANYFTDPAFQAGLAKPVHEDRDAAVLHFVRMFGDPGKTWEDLAFLREHWDGPIVLKGVWQRWPWRQRRRRWGHRRVSSIPRMSISRSPPVGPDSVPDRESGTAL